MRSIRPLAARCSRLFQCGTLGRSSSRQLSRVSYEVIFITGDERGADTDANVHATLVGETGELPVPVDNARVQFKRNSEQTVTFHTDGHGIGEVSSIRVGHDGEGTGAGWFLEKILLRISGSPDDTSLLGACTVRNGPGDLCRSSVSEDTKTVVLEFPFYGWLGRSDSGGHDGPLAADISPLPVAKWAENDGVSDEEFARLLEEAASHPLTLRTAGCCIPHPDKVTAGARAVCGKNFGYGGEDAYFNHPLGFLGVADGVYSWRAAGVDSGLYSKSLMRGALERADAAALQGDAVSAMDLFHAAVQKANADQAKGSSTVCIFGLVPLSLLSDSVHKTHNFFHSIHLGATIGQCANLGDSGIIVCRPSTNEILFRTKHQEHDFGYPYQLGHESPDTANDVQISYVGGLKAGDVIIAATDGLFDNISDDDILAVVVAKVSQKIGAQALAVELVRVAHEHSMSHSCETPYSLSATAEFDMAFLGGKPDDITCVVSYLIPSTNS